MHGGAKRWTSCYTWRRRCANSRVVRWFHYNRFRDAREGMPQLKVGHLRKLPRPQDCEAADEIAKDVDRLLLTRGRANNEVREAIEARVYAAYGLDLDQQQEIESWWRSFDGDSSNVAAG